MKKQYLFAGAGIIVVALLFFLGKTTDTKQASPGPDTVSNTQLFDIQHFIDDSRKNLTREQSLFIAKLENGISRGDVPAQQIEAFNGLANFWKDSAQLLEPYLFYLSKAAKLENSEKSLTFAAQLFLEALRGSQDEAKINWETKEAIGLFESALKLNPENDDLKIGLGSCYVYGKGRNGKPEEIMMGIQQLLSVARKDSNNMKAQVALGVGGLVSGQFDKALERFLKVVKKEPGNLEAVAYLADTYAAKGNKEEAIKWYNISKRMANNPAYSKEVDKRISNLK